jgi:hypothetical protein
MNANYEGDPTMQTVAVVRQLTDELLGSVEDPHSNDVDNWVDAGTETHYQLKRDFMGEPIVLESPDGDWNKGSTYRAGMSGLTIGTNERLSAEIPLHDRFQPVIAAMRARIAQRDQ